MIQNCRKVCARTKGGVSIGRWITSLRDHTVNSRHLSRLWKVRTIWFSYQRITKGLIRNIVIQTPLFFVHPTQIETYLLTSASGIHTCRYTYKFVYCRSLPSPQFCYSSRILHNSSVTTLQYRSYSVVLDVPVWELRLSFKQLDILFLGWIETLVLGLENRGYMRLKRG